MNPELIKTQPTGATAPRPIRLLSQEIIHRIAAGEVVDKPASLLKELLENSIDAGARNIKVTLVNGGITQIRVEDDGWGMSEQDLHACVQRHATSKIQDIKDLDSINSLGFRGEALAAAASVSSLKIDTRRGSPGEAWLLEVTGGRKMPLRPGARSSQGTLIEVSDLFFNVPARKQFLRKPSSELADCVESFLNVSLCAPDVSFELFGLDAQGEIKTERTLKASPSLERFQTVIGLNGQIRSDVWDNPDPKNPGLKVIRTHLALPPAMSHTQKSVRLTVNGRFVNEKRLPFSCREAFLGLIEVGAFPYVWIDVELDSSLLDVNVHPQKKEIRFPAGFSIAGFAYRAVQRILESSVLPRRSEVNNLSPESDANMNIFNSDLKNQQGADLKKSESKISSTASPQKFWQKPESGVEASRFDTTYSEVLRNFRASSSDLSQSVSPSVSQFLASSQESKPTQKFSELRVVGEVGAAWIICESPEGLVVIDQHAAHERVQFEKFLAKASDLVRSKPLMIPVEIKLPLGVEDYAEEISRVLSEFGFECEMGRAADILSLTALPEADRSLNWSSELKKIFEEFREGGSSGENLSEGIKKQLQIRLAASLACHGSVRRGQRLDADSIRALLRSLDEVKWGGLCPHGRPVWILVSHSKLEGLFHR